MEHTKIHLVSATDKVALGLSLSGGNEHDDAPEGRKLLTSMERPSAGTRLLLDTRLTKVMKLEKQRKS